MPQYKPQGPLGNRAVCHVADDTSGADDDGLAKAVRDRDKAKKCRETVGCALAALPPRGRSTTRAKHTCGTRTCPVACRILSRNVRN